MAEETGPTGGKGRFAVNLDTVVTGVRWTVVMVIVPALIVVVAAKGGRLGMTTTAGWLLTAFTTAAVIGLVYSLGFRIAVRVGFSLAALAMLIPMISQIRRTDLPGAYLAAGVLLVVLAFVPKREKVTAIIPHEVMMGMLGGALLSIELSFFPALTRQPWPIGAAVVVYFASKHFTRGMAPPILMALLAGAAVALALNPPQSFQFAFGLKLPKLRELNFDWKAILSVSLPMALAALGALNPSTSGLRFPAREPTVGGGVANLILAPVSGFGLWISGPGNKHPPNIPAVVANTVGLLIAAVLATTLVASFHALPFPLLRALVALALLPVALQCLMLPLVKGHTRMGGFTAILVTAANIKWLGLSAMFWGLALGTAVHLLSERDWKLPRGK